MAVGDYGGKVTKKLLLDLIQTRTPIEVQSTGLATVNATAEDFAEMSRLIGCQAVAEAMQHHSQRLIGLVTIGA